MEKSNTRIYGKEDDSLIVDGQIEKVYINWTLAQRGIPFECSDGTKGKITYNGDWVFTIDEKGSLFKEKIDLIGDTGSHKGLAFKCTPYSEVLILSVGVLWVKINGKKV